MRGELNLGSELNLVSLDFHTQLAAHQFQLLKYEWPEHTKLISKESVNFN